jgi:hypothetical protein
VPRNRDQPSPVDELIRSTVERELIKTSTYLWADQMDQLEDLKGVHRRAGRRSVSAADLIRTALEVASSHPDEWERAVVASQPVPVDRQ